MERENYVKEFARRLASFQNHPLNNYQPINFKFKGEGGYSKVLSFFSEKEKKELVIKIYPAVFYSDAKNEFNNMDSLFHENVIQVFNIFTIYIDENEQKK